MLYPHQTRKEAVQVAYGPVVEALLGVELVVGARMARQASTSVQNERV